MADDWDENAESTSQPKTVKNGDGGSTATTSSGGFSGFGGGRGGRGGGRGFRGGGGFGQGRSDEGNGEDSSEGSGRRGRGGFNRSGDGGDGGGGFGSSRGGRGGFNKSEDGEGGGDGGGFGSRRGRGGFNKSEDGGGGFGSRRGRGGFNKSEDGEGGGDGGGFGSRRGRGGFNKSEDGGDGGGGGFGSSRGRGGFNKSEDGEGGGDGGGFGSRRGRGGFNKSEDGDGGGGFGSRRGRGGFNKSGDQEEGGGGESRRGGRGGFGRRTEDGGEQSEGGGNQGVGERPRGELYIPPPPPDDEKSIFATMAAGINFDKYDDIPVDVTGADPPPHITSFEEVELFESTKATVAKCGYKKPTPVQKYAIPIILAGRDLMACAQTGSGKTAAFLLPAITKLIKEGAPGGSQAETQSPQVLIISPTRELTLQIYNEARKFTHGTVYRPVVAYGGTAVGHQLRQLEGGCNILVGTPGRLLDFLNRGKVQLDQISILILDEADRMLDMGFEPEIRKIVSNYGIPETGKRQTLMFSATFPEDIQRIANEFLHNYLFLTVGRVGGATSDITQRIIEVDEFGKREKLSEILSATGLDRTLVFVETKRNADFLATYLSQESFPTTSIHGDRFQREREEALRDFRSGLAPVLVATSVAARGLDISDVKHVINYDLPNNIEEYVHRIGRTGRIGNQGLATAFFHKDKDAPLARALIKVLADALQDVPDFLEAAAESAVGTNYGPAGGRFASKDYRQGGGRGIKGDSSGVGNDQGGFGSFSESATGGFSSSAAADEDKWD